jgi:hypothetical protein
MKEYFASYEQSLAMKELGFDEPCLFFYEGVNGIGISNDTRCRNSDTWLYKPMDCAMPLKSQIFKWFIDKHNLHAYIETTPSFDSTQGNKWKGSIKACFQPFKWVYGKYLLEDTYDKIQDALIYKLIELIKTKQD